MPVRLNPLLRAGSNIECMKCQYSPLLQRSPVHQASLTNKVVCHLKDNMHDLLSGEASWRKMYLCDPPCTTARAWINFEVQRSPRYFAVVRLTVKDPDGITFGTLFDRALQAVVHQSGNKKGPPVSGLAEDYVRLLEATLKRKAYVKASGRIDFGTSITLYGVMIPSEDQWRQVGS